MRRVLLKNADGQLPLIAGRVKSIAVIGAHADVGVISGGGSGQVDPAGGNAVKAPGVNDGDIMAMLSQHVYHRSAPLNAIRAKVPNAKVTFDAGSDLAEAAAAAKSADVAIVFAVQHESEGGDLPNLSLPDNQDALINAVYAANPHTIVVFETGGAVTMPWIDKVSGIMEAWYRGVQTRRQWRICYLATLILRPNYLSRSHAAKQICRVQHCLRNRSQRIKTARMRRPVGCPTYRA